MGKRKSKARVMKKAVATVPTIFDCMFCNHSKTVECRLNQLNNLGTIKCRVCKANFQMEINHLHDPIDVYSEWIDETEKANRLHRDPVRSDEVEDFNGPSEIEVRREEQRQRQRQGEQKSRAAQENREEEEEEELEAEEEDEVEAHEDDDDVNAEVGQEAAEEEEAELEA
jgi:transcription elongation factor Elf1